MLDDARERAAITLGCKPGEIVFTGGGTESVNMAILGTARSLRNKGRHIVTSAIEHHAVLHACRYLESSEEFEVTYLPVDRQGIVSPDEVRQTIRPETILVSLMAANNEIGTIQPVAEIGAICEEKGVVFHTDAVQWFGKEPFSDIDQFHATLVSICGHKFHGPKGTGALYIRSPFRPDPILFGGAHENERRAGTENLAGILGFVTALEQFAKEPVFPRDRLTNLTESLIAAVEAIPSAWFVGSKTSRLANTVSFVTRDTDSIGMLANLDLEGVCASSGSACSAGSLEPSHVVQALGVEPSLSNSLVRFSLGRESTQEEVDYVARILPEVISRSQINK
jgi:cysteine desulfurase